MARRTCTWARCVLLLVALSAPASADPAPPLSGLRQTSPWRRRLLQVPRLVLALPRELVHLLTYPVVKVAAWDERTNAFANIIAAVTFKDGQAGIRPSFEFLRDFHSLVGLTYFDGSLLGKDTNLFLKLETAGQQAVVASAVLRPTPITSPVAFDVGAYFVRRDDYLFAGIRSLSPPGYPLIGARYLIESIDLRTRVTLKLGPFALGGGDEVAVKRFGEGTHYAQEHDIDNAYCAKRLVTCIHGTVDDALVPRFDEGTQFFRTKVFVGVDTRRYPDLSRGGFASFTTALTQGLGSDDGRYIRFSGELGGTINLWHNARFLVLRMSVDDLVQLHGTTPFSELPSLGGPDDLRGYRLDRFRDYSSAMVTVEYRWRIYLWADAALFSDLGTTAGPGFSDFSGHELHPDVGVAIRVHTKDKFILRLQVAYGFDDGVQFAFTGGDKP